MKPTDAAPILVLRPAVPSDLPAVAEVYLAARSAAVPMMPASPRAEHEIRRWITGGGLARLETWVTRGDQGVIGFAAFTRTWLDHLYVLPEAQGLGVGTALLDLVKARLRDGFGLWAFQSNTAARAFYRRHGLVESEVTDGSENDERSPEVRLEWRPDGRPCGLHGVPRDDDLQVT